MKKRRVHELEKQQHIEMNCAENSNVPESTWSMKIGTVVALVLALISIAMGGVATWVGYISSRVNTHGEEIAAIKANATTTLSTLTRIEGILDDVRNDQIRRQVKEAR
jgi:hypothetical protein